MIGCHCLSSTPYRSRSNAYSLCTRKRSACQLRTDRKNKSPSCAAPKCLHTNICGTSPESLRVPRHFRSVSQAFSQEKIRLRCHYDNILRHPPVVARVGARPGRNTETQGPWPAKNTRRVSHLFFSSFSVPPFLSLFLVLFTLPLSSLFPPSPLLLCSPFFCSFSPLFSLSPFLSFPPSPFLCVVSSPLFFPPSSSFVAPSPSSAPCVPAFSCPAWLRRWGPSACSLFFSSSAPLLALARAGLPRVPGRPGPLLAFPPALFAFFPPLFSSRFGPSSAPHGAPMLRPYGPTAQRDRASGQSVPL